MSTVDRTPKQIVDDVAGVAVAHAVANGAVRGTVEIAEMEMIPLAVRVCSLLFRRTR